MGDTGNTALSRLSVDKDMPPDGEPVLTSADREFMAAQLKEALKKKK